MSYCRGSEVFKLYIAALRSVVRVGEASRVKAPESKINVRHVYNMNIIYNHLIDYGNDNNYVTNLSFISGTKVTCYYH